MKYIRFKAPDLAIDLGTASIRLARLDRQNIYEEPCVIALDYKKMEIVAIGREAKELIGKSPENIIAVSPLEGGVVSDYDLTQALLEYYIRLSLPGISLLAPRITISFPSGATDVEQRAIRDACLQSGARDVFLVEEALASAFGSGRLESATGGAFILNIGAGSSQIAVVNRYGVICSETIRRAGNSMDKAIASYIKEKYKLEIGSSTAEEIKINISSLKADKQERSMEISGRDLLTAMPKTIEVFAYDITEAIRPFIEELIDKLRLVLEKTPPELSGDIMKEGLLMTGGLSRLDGLDEYIQAQLNISCSISENPDMDTIMGARYIMKHINALLREGDHSDKI